MTMGLKDLLDRYPGAQTFKFGDSAKLSADLLALVRAGRKTATCGALRDYPSGSPETPVVGRRDIALDWDDRPALVIETVDVSICRFCDMTKDFALAEGENDTLEGWREDHRRYFERNGGFDPEMELLCERFRLIEDLAIEV
ncbi:ASCH domain-containing protein [Ruegeria arenilitoris]|uniref:ASCH domain-containing protein n=1 Tax=Ruegeria arenilitoris TaxID=1173585 RepID=UPI00148127A4|nr:ASCH domain-containing protein [Ruegeria arenilitoris]